METKVSDTILKDLNKEQKEAVTYKEDPLLTIAGAGTGKTTVISRRIACIGQRSRICNAFTLLELLIVIAIVAILAGSMVPLFMESRVDARDTRRFVSFKSVQKALEMYRVDNGFYPPRHRQISDPNGFRGWGELENDLAPYINLKEVDERYVCYDACIGGYTGEVRTANSDGYGLKWDFESPEGTYYDCLEENDGGDYPNAYEAGPDPKKSGNWFND